MNKKENLEIEINNNDNVAKNIDKKDKKNKAKTTEKKLEKNIKKTVKKADKESKKTQKKASAKANKETAKTKVKEDKTKIEKIEYFGHKEGENIYESFLVNKMIAHRGFYDEECPENSLSAFEKAIEKGYAIELDINVIADGTPVVFHDTKMSRMTNRDKYIQNLTAEELETTTLLNTKEKIPTLKETLEFVNGRTPIIIEIKTQEKIGDMEKQVLELLKNYKGQYAIQSFNPYVLNWFYNNAPKIWRGQLAGYFKGEKLSFIKKLVLRRLGMNKVSKPDFVSYDIRNLPNRHVRKLEMPLLAWTLNNQQDYIKAIQYADNVIFENFEPTI